MKKVSSTILTALLTLFIFLSQDAISQVPQKMSYQTVVRNVAGDLVSESLIGIRISILQDSATGTSVFTEAHTIMTNINGLASMEVGVGNPPSVAFSQINWGNGPYFIKSEIDPTGGTDYTLTGSTQLLSVPYALYARIAGNSSFTTIENVTSNTNGDQTDDDFVFGSPQIDDDGVFDHRERMFFQKWKGVFRAGRAIGDEWDSSNTGIASIAFGIGTKAFGYNSTAMGHRTSAPSYVETVIGIFNTDYTPLSSYDWNDQDRLFVIGNGQYESLSDAMVVLKNGNVGLGNSTPNEVLEVAGDGRAFFGNGQGDDRRGLLIDGIQGPTAARIEAYDYGLAEGIDLVFNSTPNGGNVGIGTNSPTARLSVNGTANKTGGGSWAVFSDRRLKKDINDYEDGLSTVLAINPVKFKYNGISKADTINQYIGVIAQELEKVSPYMINTIGINGTEYLEVDNSAMTYMLINAIKEQQEIIENLKRENTALSISQHKEISELKTQVSKQNETLKANTTIMKELQSTLNIQTKN